MFYSGIFGLDNFRARFSNPEKVLLRPQKWLTIYSIFLIYPALIASSIIVFINVIWGYQALVAAIEALFFWILFIILHIFERCYDPTP